MNRVRKHYQYLIWGSLLILFLATRLYNLLGIPIFTDEAIYIRWVEIFTGDVHQFFISLTDGKQPLFVWAGSASMHVFHGDPLLAVRLVSVGTGLLAMVGLYFLTKELFQNKTTAFIASLLYIIFPIALTYDKLALYDSMLAMFAIWALYLEVLLVKQNKAWIAVLVGLVIGGGLLTKSSAWFFIYLMPLSLLLFDFRAKKPKRQFLKWGVLALVAITIAYLCYSALRFSPNFHYLADKNNVFVEPVHVWIKHPLGLVRSNTPLLVSELVGYATIPFLLLVLLSFGISKRYTKEKLVLLAWFILPFLVLDLFGNHHYLYSRYILFMMMPLLCLAAFSITELYQRIQPKYLAVIVCFLLIAPMTYKEYFILTDFSKASVPATDYEQLISGYSSGIGVQETVQFLKSQSAHQNIYVATQGIFGLMPQSLEDYFWKNPNLTIKGFWPIGDSIPQEVIDASKVMPTYFIFYAPCPACEQTGMAPRSWQMKRLFQINKINKDSYYTLYQLTAQ